MVVLPIPFVFETITYSSLVFLYRYGVNQLEAALAPLVSKGLKSVLIFGVPSKIEKVCMICIVKPAHLHVGHQSVTTSHCKSFNTFIMGV